jgi:hypothetical protein
MKKDIVEALQRPFEKGQVRSRRGPGGKSFRYVAAHDYIDRLNELACGWDFIVEELRLVNNADMIARGHLVIDGERRSDVGGATLTVTRDGEIVDDLPNLAKKAVSDLLKRCSRHFGLGNALWSSDEDEAQDRRSNGNGHRRPDGNGRSNGNGHGRSGTNGNNGPRVTQKQLGALWGLARALGQTADQLRQRSVEVYGTQPEHLSRGDASSLITQLSEALS